MTQTPYVVSSQPGPRHTPPMCMEPRRNHEQLGGAQRFYLDPADQRFYELPPIRCHWPDNLISQMPPSRQALPSSSTLDIRTVTLAIPALPTLQDPPPPPPSASRQPLPHPPPRQPHQSARSRARARARARDQLDNRARFAPLDEGASLSQPLRAPLQPRREPRRRAARPPREPGAWSWHQVDQLNFELRGGKLPRVISEVAPHLVEYMRQASWDRDWLPIHESRPCMEDFMLTYGGTQSRPPRFETEDDTDFDQFANDIRMDELYSFSSAGPSLAFVTQPTMAISNCAHPPDGSITKHAVGARYLLGIMLAMARKQKIRRGNRPRHRSTPEFPSPSGPGGTGTGDPAGPFDPFPVNLIVAPGPRDNYLYFYAAEVSPNFLDQVESERVRPSSGQLIIYYYKLPLHDPTALAWHLMLLIEANRV